MNWRTFIDTVNNKPARNKPYTKTWYKGEDSLHQAFRSYDKEKKEQER